MQWRRTGGLDAPSQGSQRSEAGSDVVASDAPPDAPPPTRSRSSRLLERCKAEERRLLFGGEGEYGSGYGYYEGEEYADAEAEP